MHKRRLLKAFSRDALGKIVGTSGAVIGRYEITPSVEIAKRIADALDVSLDYLTGSTSFARKLGSADPKKW